MTLLMLLLGYATRWRKKHNENVFVEMEVVGWAPSRLGHLRECVC